MPRRFAVFALGLWRDTTPEIPGEGGATALVWFSLTEVLVCRYKSPE
jgi:hypothetical protein